MTFQPLDEELAIQAVNALRQHGNKSAAARALGLDRCTYRGRLKAAERLGLTDRTTPAPTGFEVKELTETRDKNGNLKSQSTKYRTESGNYQIPEGMNVKHVSLLSEIGEDGEKRSRLIWEKAGKGELSPEQIAANVRAAFEGFTPKAPNIWRLKEHDEDVLTVYPLADWHLGMFAWGKETDGPDWDLKIAERVLTDTFQELVDRAPKSRKAVVLGLGDLMHADSHKNQTPGSGNIMDVDTRYQKVLPKLCDIVIQNIEFVRHKHAEIEAEFKAGNHDPASTVAIRTGLDLYYRNDKHMTVNTSPSPFWWAGHGVNMLCGTHGDGAKIKDIPGVMASYKPKMWGASTSRHAFTGHIHHERCFEDAGVRVWALRAPIPSDAWHSFEGYLSGRSMFGFHFHRTKGAVGRTEVEIH